MNRSGIHCRFFCSKIINIKTGIIKKMFKYQKLKEKSIYTFLFVSALFTTYSYAQEKVYHIETIGMGRYTENADPKDIDKGNSYIAKIPKVIREGEILQISYDDENKIKEEKFEVQNIINIGGKCRIHNKVVSDDGDFSGDVIYVEPCKVFIDN